MRIIACLALSLTLVAGGCTTPDGRPDPGATLGLAAGLAAVGGLVYLATQNGGGQQSYHGGGYRGGYGGGWGGGHRGYGGGRGGYRGYR